MAINKRNLSKKKNIVLCSDGTGQSGGGGNNTNVWRIYDAIDVNNQDIKQMTFYDDGVGTNKNFIMKAIGLGFGFGLSKNIRQLYKNAVIHYKPGDNLYLFGFSRGAHTIRLLAEMICSFGILNPKSFDNEEQLDEAIFQLQKKFKAAIRRAWVRKLFSTRSSDKQAVFRKETVASIQLENASYNKQLEKMVKKQQQPDQVENIVKDVEIAFVGVWDTVSAVGMPVEEMRENYFFAEHAFVDNKLHKNIKRACHALAIDEKRHTFKPELWDQSSAADKERIEQVWFSGVHANVGGGYPKDQLSLVSLEWMMCEASKVGLIFRESRLIEITNHANHNGTLYDSRSGAAAFYRYKPRNVMELTQKSFADESNTIPKIHISVFQRIMDSPAVYSPINLHESTEIISNHYSDNKIYHKRVLEKQEECNSKIEQCKIDSKNSKKSGKKNSDNPWNVVWWHKIMHFVFLMFIAAFLTTGYQLTKKTPVIEVTYEQQTFKIIQKSLKAINELNPLYFTNKILPGYANHWQIALLMMAILVLLLFLNAVFKKHHDNIANLLWNHEPYNTNQINAKRLHVNSFLYVLFGIAGFFRKWKILNKAMIPSFKNKILPILMTLLFAGVIAAAILYLFAPDMIS